LSEQGQQDPSELLRQQSVLAKFGEFALCGEDLDDILNEACRLVGEGLGTDLAKIMELRPDKKDLLVRAGVGWKPGVVGVVTLAAEGDTPESYALQTNEPVISPDIAAETRFSYPEFILEHGVKAFANVPIRGAKG
jgi:GAF domain-containing protein